MPSITTTQKFQSDSEGIKEKIVKGEHFNENPSSTLSIDLIMKITATIQRIEYGRKKRGSEPETKNISENSKRQRGSSSSHESPLKVHESSKQEFSSKYSRKPSPESRHHRQSSPRPSTSRGHQKLPSSPKSCRQSSPRSSSSSNRHRRISPSSHFSNHRTETPSNHHRSRKSSPSTSW